MNITKKRNSTIELEGTQYYKDLHIYCMRHVNFNKEIADYCVQETYLKFEEKVTAKKDSIKNCRGWLFTVLRNNINSYYNTVNKTQCKETNLELLNQDETRRNIADPNINVETIVEAMDFRATVLNRANHLNNDDKQLFLDFYFYDMSLKEIAKKTNKSLSAIKKQHERLKKKLFIIYQGDLENLRRCAQ